MTPTAPWGFPTFSYSVAQTESNVCNENRNKVNESTQAWSNHSRGSSAFPILPGCPESWKHQYLNTHMTHRMKYYMLRRFCTFQIVSSTYLANRIILNMSEKELVLQIWITRAGIHIFLKINMYLDKYRLLIQKATELSQS